MYVHRLHALLLWANVGCLRRATALCGDSPRSLERWRQRLESGGESALRDEPHGGRLSCLSPAQLQRLRGLLFDAADSGHPPTVRDLHDRLIDSFGTPMSLRQCRRLMAALRQTASADMAGSPPLPAQAGRRCKARRQPAPAKLAPDGRAHRPESRLGGWPAPSQGPGPSLRPRSSIPPWRAASALRDHDGARDAASSPAALALAQEAAAAAAEPTLGEVLQHRGRGLRARPLNAACLSLHGLGRGTRQNPPPQRSRAVRSGDDDDDAQDEEGGWGGK